MSSAMYGVALANGGAAVMHVGSRGGRGECTIAGGGGEPGGSVMTAGEVRQRLLAEIERRALADRYIDRDEEREVLQFAVQVGYGTDDARAELARVCGERGYVVESAVLGVIREQIAAAMADDGKIDRAEFERALHAAKAAMGGVKPDAEVKRLLVQMMEDTGTNRTKRGLFGNWYARLKRELGVV